MAVISWIAVALFVMGVTGPARAQTPVDEIAKAHNETRAQLTPLLPKRVDEMMDLMAVRADGVTLTYEYRLARDKANLSPDADIVLGRKAIAMACGNLQMRKIMQVGGRYGFEFRDRFDEKVLSVTVGKDDCVPIPSPLAVLRAG